MKMVTTTVAISNERFSMETRDANSRLAGEGREVRGGLKSPSLPVVKQDHKDQRIIVEQCGFESESKSKGEM